MGRPCLARLQGQDTCTHADCYCVPAHSPEALWQHPLPLTALFRQEGPPVSPSLVLAESGTLPLEGRPSGVATAPACLPERGGVSFSASLSVRLPQMGAVLWLCPPLPCPRVYPLCEERASTSHLGLGA